MESIRTLLIDNYDSYTYNLHQILTEVNGGECRFIRLCGGRGLLGAMRPV